MTPFAVVEPLHSVPDAAFGPDLTPAGLQRRAVLTRRRAVVATLCVGSWLAVLWGAWQVFGAGSVGPLDLAIMAGVALGAPWTIMGAWTALIGLWLWHGRRGGLAAAAPHLAAGAGDAPVRLKTAVLMFLRNEAPDRALARLAEVRRGLDATGHGAAYDVYVLSDSDDPEIVAAEAEAFARWRPLLGGAVHRRREVNTAFKAGNVRDWLGRWGAGHDLFLPLDSDSLMGGDAIVSMTRIMQAHPKIGILQSLVVGAPALSAFARLFQFGMRHGMRSYTLGAAWWQGDCGPYWGHNALVRVAPFAEGCELPERPGRGPLSGPILSHDQIEAVLMRRAGYEVRVIPVEGASWEDNPPSMMEFTRRDLRWCQGNMQYWGLMGMPGLQPASRFQIFAAVMMYFGAPAWMLMTLAAAMKVATGDVGGIDFAFGLAMFLVMFAMSFVPKVAGWIDVALTPGGVARYGGARRFAAGAAAETAFSMLLAPAAALRVSIFLAGLLMGRKVGWSGQQRDAQALRWSEAARGLWPQAAFGAALTGLLLWGAAGALPWAAPVLAGLTLAIPFAVVTAAPSFGRWMARAGLCAIPEEAETPAPLLGLAALTAEGDVRAPLRAA